MKRFHDPVFDGEALFAAHHLMILPDRSDIHHREMNVVVHRVVVPQQVGKSRIGDLQDTDSIRLATKFFAKVWSVFDISASVTIIMAEFGGLCFRR